MHEGLVDQGFWEDAWVRHLEQYLSTPPRAGLWLAARFPLAAWRVLELAGGSCRDSRYLAEQGVAARRQRAGAGVRGRTGVAVAAAGVGLDAGAVVRGVARLAGRRRAVLGHVDDDLVGLTGDAGAVGGGAVGAGLVTVHVNVLAVVALALSVAVTVTE